MFLHGRIVYDFSMKSYSYPEFTEFITITREGFLSQIGGILGLYLGVSGLTVFMIILKAVKFIRKLKRARNSVLQQGYHSVNSLNRWTRL